MASKLFDKSLNEPPYPTCRSIRMDLKFESGVQWVDVIPEDYPTETWYTTTVYYEFTFEMNPDMTLSPCPVRRRSSRCAIPEPPPIRCTNWSSGEISPGVTSSPSSRGTGEAGASFAFREIGMNVRWCLAALMAGALLFLACGDEEVVGGCDPCPPPKTFQPLTEREHVLNNLELSYNERAIAQFDSLLDPDFIFYFAPGDVRGAVPTHWGSVEETSVTTMLFDPYLNTPGVPVWRSIRMDLKFESGVSWTDTIPPAYPTETWHTTTVYYEFTMEIAPDGTYIAVPGTRAQITVRNVGTDDAPQWRLVAWRDLSGGSAALQSPASTESASWGQIKAMYVGAVFPREEVLADLEASYNRRNATRFGELLDDNFTFFFAPGDVGGNIPEQWGRDNELRVTLKLFDQNLNEPPYPTCRYIRMDLKLESGVQWVAVIPEDFPGETWHTATVLYDFTFEMVPDQTYSEVPGALAQFTVRNDGTDSAPQWSLVEWRDLGSSATAQAAIGTESTTWGGVKALYK